jgi:soluble lytic murein transglycosylase
MRRIVWAVGLMLLILAAAAGWFQYHTTQYDHIIDQAAARNGVNFYLIKALVFQESWFRPDIRGGSGELGLMQVSMGAASDFCTRKGFLPFYAERLLEPELNLEIGCWYLRQSIERYKHTPAPELFALLRYNAGQARADAWVNQALSNPVPPGISPERYYLSLVDIPQTREYVSSILQRARTHQFWF